MDDYKDLINYEYLGPMKHSRMSIYNRSAQFAPFAALNGYSDEVKETERITDTKIELNEDLKNILNEKIMNLKINQTVNIEYFVKDKKKDGGKYIIKCGIIKKIDYVRKEILLSDKTKISINDILNIK